MPGRFERRRRHGDRLQLPGQQQPREQLGVLAVALDPITRSARRLRRRNHLQRQPRRLRGTVERKAGRARLVAALERLRQRLQPADHLVAAAAEARTTQLAARDVDRGDMGRTGVDIQAHVRHRCGHGRTLLPLHGVSRSQSPARQTPDLQTRGSGLQALAATQPP
jgi:predicted nucleic acid-binding protein